MNDNIVIAALFAGTMSLLVSCTAIERASDNMTYRDPVIVRADVVHDAGTGLVPTLVRTGNDLVVGWATEGGDGEPGQATSFARSSDGGRTWSSPYLTRASNQPLTGRYATLQRLPNDTPTSQRTLLYELDIVWQDMPDQKKPNWGSLVNSRRFDSYYAVSTDGGRTFGPRTRLSNPVKRHDFSQGNIIELPNGDLLWPWGNWGNSPLNGFKRSTDGGITWSPVVRAWQDPPPGHDTPLAFNETAATVCKDGTIVAVARVDGAPGHDKRFWQITSSDNGRTWTPPRQIEIAGGSPAMYCTPQGQLWLAYRDGGVGPGLGLAVSDDNAQTWRFLYHLKDPKGEHQRLYGHIRYTDEDRSKPWRPAEGMVGYPCFAKLSDTDVYVVYHLYNRTELPETLPEGAVPFYIAGNLLRTPQ